MALLWVKWAAFLSTKADSFHEVVLFGTQRVTKKQWADLREAAAQSVGIHFLFAVAPDEDESGYPRSANHLFVRALECCTGLYPDRAVLWMETDCVPVREGWFELVQQEYEAATKPFMGVYVESVAPHMAGCGVYPPDWRTQSPALLTSLSAPDEMRLWGAGKGQPWDTWAGAEISANMHRSKTIQQIWRPGTFNTGNINRVLPETALFHQCKNGSLIATICHMRFPEFAGLKPVDEGAYMMLTSRPELSILDTTLTFKPCARGPGGAAFCVFKPSSAMEEALVSVAVEKFGVERISNAEYDNLMLQSKKLSA